MIAGFFPEPHVPVDAGRDEAAGKQRAQQQVIDTNAGIAGHGVPKYFQKV